MWAYRSYNDDAPLEPEPRFSVPLDSDNRKGKFSWSSLYPRLKKGKQENPEEPTSPLKTIAGFLTGRPKATGYDERLDKIMEMLELLLEADKTEGRTQSITSRRSRQPRFRDYNDDEDDEDDGDDDNAGSVTGKRTRPSLRRRANRSPSATSSRHTSLATVADAAVKAAAKDWHAKGENADKLGLKERLKSSVKAGAKAAGRSGLGQAKQSVFGRTPSARIASIASDESFDNAQAAPNPITSQLSDFNSVGMDGLAAMLEAKRKEGFKSKAEKTSATSSNDKDRHKRFRQEVLNIPDDSPGIDEDLLDGLLPPADGYDLESHPEGLSSNKISKRREDIVPKKSADSKTSQLRPLHFDPSLPAVQSFAWPDADEIAEQSGKDAQTTGKSALRSSKNARHEGSSSKTGASYRSRSGQKTGMDDLLQQMMRSGIDLESISNEDIRRLSAPPGRIPSPLKMGARGDISRSLGDEDDKEREYSLSRGLQDDSFGIAWPSTPTHEPGYDSLPEYVSPATEAFNHMQQQAHHTRAQSAPPRAPTPEEEAILAPAASQNQVLFQRVVSTMDSCLGKAKALAQKQHQYQSERLSTSAESVVLRAIGSWLMKQIPPLQRANELFSFAESECMFAFLEELVRMDGLLGHPVLQRERWDSDVYEHLQAETDSLQRCFLGVASTAVVRYLQRNNSRLTDDMPRVLYTCYEMLKERPKDSSQVLLVLPKIRAQLRDARGTSVSRYSGDIDEAEGLLDILYELTIELGTGAPANLPSDSGEENAPGTSEPYAPQVTKAVHSSIHPSRDIREPAVKPSTRSDDEVYRSRHFPGNGPGQPHERRRGFAADFFNAPTPSETGFSRPVLEDLGYKQNIASRAASRIEQDRLPENTAMRNIMRGDQSTAILENGKAKNIDSQPPPNRDAGSQLGESLLMAMKPQKTSMQFTEADQPTEDQPLSADETKGSSSSSDEGYQSGMEASSILPILLRKKLEGKRKNLTKPPLSGQLGLANMTREQPRFIKSDKTPQRPPPPVEIVSRDSPTGSVVKLRSPGSYFPPTESLTMVPKSQEDGRETLLMRPGPVAHKPSVYTPITASPLRASTSLMSPEDTHVNSAGIDQAPSMTTPTGVVFSDPFANGSQVGSGNVVDQLQSDVTPFYTPMVSPSTEDIELDTAAEAILDDVEEEQAISDNESIKSNEVLTSEDIKAGLLDGDTDEELLDEGIQALTDAEKTLAAREPEALIPGPRAVITSRDVRDHLVSYDDFSPTYTGAVPRVAVTPGAIQNTKGEVVPIDDEDIHLAAGETLIDGTGRVWNAKGMIEPGRDEQGEPILYEVDIAQIKRANNGEMPVMMPWDDERLLPEGSRTPSYTPSEDMESATPMSEISEISSGFDTPIRRPSRRISESDLNAVDRQLAMVEDIPEEDEDDVPMDEIALAEAEEEEEAREREEEEFMKRKEEERKKTGRAR